MVHAATCSHHDIVRELLLAGVHVYVDKPLDNSYAESRQLVELAKRQGKILMVGFNRRYAPLYQEVRQDLKNPVIVLMQKNRANSPQPTRDVIFDDFIHVVDTILSMLPSPVQRWCVQGQHQGDRLTSVAVHMVAQNCAAMGMMNLMNGVDEELLEVMGTGVKWSVRELREAVKCDNQRKYQMTLDGWSTVESVKGFTGIVDAFLALVKAHDLTSAEQIVGEALETHRLCDEIVRALEGQPGPMTPLRLGR
jgi:virulence factor